MLDQGEPRVNMGAEFDWAHETFKNIDLGDSRRARRLILMLASMISNNNGFVTQSFLSIKETKAAYRWLNNEEINIQPILEESAKSCLQTEDKCIVVPIDGSSVSIKNNRNLCLGHIGTSNSKQRGYKVISALAYTQKGEPLGLMGQIYWKRSKEIKPTKSYEIQKKRLREFKEKENHYIVQIANHCESIKDQCSPSKKLWFQHDRGADDHEILEHISKSNNYWTLRISQDRNVKDQHILKLLGALSVVKPCLTATIRLPRCGSHDLFIIQATIKATPIDIYIRKCNSESKKEVSFYAIEIQGVHDHKIVRWRLLTNYPIRSYKDILLVIENYKLRWSIEEFHRTWKDTCKTEDIQLRQEKPVQLWCTLNAVISMRIERLKKISREQPDLEATSEFSEEEIKAILLMRKPKREDHEKVTLQQAVYWLAELGGYQGRTSSGGPPGATVIGRGLERISPVASLLVHYDLAPKLCG